MFINKYSITSIHHTTYPVVITYPRTGAPSDRLGLLQDNVIDRDVNPVTIGRPGGLGTSEILEYLLNCEKI